MKMPIESPSQQHCYLGLLSFYGESWNLVLVFFSLISNDVDLSVCVVLSVILWYFLFSILLAQFPVCKDVQKFWGQLVATLFISSVQFSDSVVSDSLQSHGLQLARLPCPSPTLFVLLPFYPSWHSLPKFLHIIGYKLLVVVVCVCVCSSLTS